MGKREREKNIAKAADPDGAVKHQWLIFVSTLIIYSSTCYRTIPGGDSSEIITSAYELGVAHPPGYPLITILLNLWLLPVRFIGLQYIPVASALLNSIIASVGACCLFKLIKAITSCTVSGIIGTALFCFSPNCWEWASNLEVFTLNNLLCILVVQYAVEYFQAVEYTEVEYTEVKNYTKRKKYKNKVTTSLPLLTKGVMISALALTNQHTSIIYIIPIALGVLFTELKTSDGIPVLHLIKCACIPLALYLYLPISALFCSARWQWGDCTSISGILTHVLRAEYGTFSLAAGHKAKSLTLMLLHNLMQFKEEFGAVIVIIGFLGMVITFCSPHVKSGRLVCYLFVIYTFFFNWRCDLDPSNMLHRGVISRFYLQNGILFSIFISVGINWTMRKLDTHTRCSNGKLIVGAYTITALLIAVRYQKHSYSQFNHVADFGNTLMNSFPSGSIVLMKGDLPSNTFRYFNLVENKRLDVAFIDTQPMTYDWYLKFQKERFSGIAFPGLRYRLTGEDTFSMKDFIKANPTRNIFGCISISELEPITRDEFTVLPWGSCDQFFLKSNYTFDNDLVTREQYVSQQIGIWHYSTSGTQNLPKHSWEMVANDEMWNGKVRSAMLAYEESQYWEEKQDMEKAQGYLKQSYILYSAAIDAEKHGDDETPQIPAHWYKNFGIIHPKLVSLGDANAIGSYAETVSNFEKYLSVSALYGERIEDAEIVQKAIDDIKFFLHQQSTT